jgi:hypothetical protein
MMPPRKAALIEIAGSHNETLYSQLLYLKHHNYHTTLICSANLKEHVQGMDCADETVYFGFDSGHQEQERKQTKELHKYLTDNKIDTIILNTAHGRTIRNFLLYRFPKGTVIAGTLHGINKLRGSLTQKIISWRMGRYYLLNDYLKENLYMVPHKGLRFEVFYPMFFQQLPYAPAVVKPQDEIWIGVPGSVEFKRRDYMTLVEVLAKMPVKPNYKFLLLGDGDHPHGNFKELKAAIEAAGLLSYFKFWHGYLGNAEFHAYIQQCDAMMPLIHPINDDLKKYLNDQISGSYNLAFAYKKPLLMHRYFEKYADFKENAIFYSLDTLDICLMNFTQEVEERQGQFYQHPKWTLEYQAEQYVRLLQQ